MEKEKHAMISLGSTRHFRQTAPGRHIWMIAAVILILIRLPILLLCYLFPNFRPHPRWTYRQAVMNSILHAGLYHISRTEWPTDVSVQDQQGTSQAVGGKSSKTIGKPDHIVLYSSQSHPAGGAKQLNGLSNVLTQSTIRPERIAGIWYRGTQAQGSSKERSAESASAPDSRQITTILYFHGGAFVLGDASPTVCLYPASVLGRTFGGADVLAFSYRLASDPEGSFPAALQDAVTAYQHLLEVEKIQPQSILFAGDSAGCNIALALLRYISASQNAFASSDAVALPAPRGALLCSPWVDVIGALDRSMAPTEKYFGLVAGETDYLPRELLAWGLRRYVSRELPAEAEQYISPYNHPFPTTARLFFLFGGLEVLKDEGAHFAKQMQDFVDKASPARNQVKVHVETLATHAFLGSGNITGFGNSAHIGVEKAKDFFLSS